MAEAKERFSSFEEEISERFKDGKELFSELESDAGARLKRGAKQADEVVHENHIMQVGLRIGRFGCRCVVEPPLMRIC